MKSSRGCRRRFLQFGLRTLIVMVIVAALGALWLRSEVVRARNQRLAVESLRKLGGEVNYQHEFDADNHAIVSPAWPGPAWIEDLLGENLFLEGRYVAFKQLSATDADLAGLQHLPDIKGISLELERSNLAAANGVGDATILRLAGMHNLEFINLENTKLTDSGAAAFLNLTNVQKVWIVNADLTDEGMQSFRRMRNLEYISFQGMPRVSDAGFECLAQMTKMKKIRWPGSGLTGPGLKALRGMQQLWNLHVNDAPIGDDGLEYLRELSALTSLSLDRTKVSDAGLAKLGKMPALRDLGLSGTKITDEGLKHLGECEQLETLGLSHCAIRGPGLADLARLPNLRSLSLAGCKLQWSTITPGARLQQIKTLGLAETQLTDADVAQLIDFAPNLTELDISQTQVTDEVLAQIARLKQLDTLHIGGTRISTFGLARHFSGTQLRTVYFDLEQFPLEEMKQLRAALPQLILHYPLY